MSQEVTKIKSRIKSVSGALKVTSAMKLVSTVKLKRWRNKMLANREYSSYIDEITDEILNYTSIVETPFSQTNKTSKKDLYIVVSSTLGLCGAYNNNIFKLADASIKPEDDAIILGGKGLIHFSNGEFGKVEEFSSYSSIEDNYTIKSLTEFVINEYVKGTYRTVHMIYSSYKNSIAFIPKDYVVLPISKSEKKEQITYPPILEPSEEKLVSELVPIYLKTTIYSKLLESEVCEQASRCNAMDNATNNANEILDALKIEFNKARQGAITQEIIEIAAAAEAI